MSVRVWRQIKGRWELAGSFRAQQETEERRAGSLPRVRGERWLFAYDPSYLENHDADPLSISLPLRVEPYEHADYQAFFDGMVPEGFVRAYAAEWLRVPRSDYLRLLWHLGDECVGALRFTSDADAGEATPSYEQVAPEELLRLAERPDQESARRVVQTRLSLAGAQDKIGLYLDPEESEVPRDKSTWYLPLGSAPSTHVVKVASRDDGEVASNEAACMALAEELGVPIAETTYLASHPTMTFSRRYDRFFADGTPSVGGHMQPTRLHQEDFCQALGLPAYLKYEVHPSFEYARRAAGLIAFASANPLEDLRAFARATLVDYLVGNCDNHLKNHSLLYTADWYSRRLAPAYDILSTTILGYDRVMGFSIGGARRIDDVAAGDWLTFAGQVRVGESWLRSEARRIVAELGAARERAAKRITPTARESLGRVMEDARGRVEALSQL